MKKVCKNCVKPIPGLPGQPKRHYATWTCRGCGKKVCRHFCRFKDGGKASCGECQRLFMRPGAVEA